MTNIEKLELNLKDICELANNINTKTTEDERLLLFMKKKVVALQEVVVDMKESAAMKKPILEDDNPFLNRPVKPLTIVDYEEAHRKAMEEQELRLGIKTKPRPSHIMADPADLGERDPEWG